MTTTLAGRQRVPDILECLAQLSSDEVPTPPRLANAVLDLLPADVWRNPGIRWLDPFSKSGVFMREIVKRLLFEGLVEWEPDFEKRREHVLRNMIFGCAITEMTGIISRRTVYYSRHAAGEHSAIRFDSDDGNIPFVRAEHDFNQGRCRICGAPEDLERGEGRENYAYAFIHGAYPTQEMEDMKFDVIVGNPPYQIDSDGNTRTMPVYQKFVEKAIEINPQYIAMITPSRWMAGGLGLDDFRSAMLSDRRIRKLVDHPNAGEVFPGVEIKGGVSYFLWDRNHDGSCEVVLSRGGERSDPTARDLGEFDVFVRDRRSVAILRKVLEQNEPSMTEIMASNNEYGIGTNEHLSARQTSSSIRVHAVQGGRRVTGWIERDSVPRGIEGVDRWKVLVPKSYGAGEQWPHQILGQPVVAEPPAASTQTWVVIYADDEQQARYIESYLRTRFFRFLVSLRKITQHAPVPAYKWVPKLNWDRTWTDPELYERYGLTEDEIAFIESQVKEMPAPARAV